MTDRHDAKDLLVPILALAAALLRWMAQPPLAFWPFVFVAVVPLIAITRRPSISRRAYWAVWAASFVFWAASLQGLRHAHPVMYASWMVLAAYLSIYPVLFVSLCRRANAYGIPAWIICPMIWVGLECLRNYFATGISAAMIGHTLADVPIMIQIADCFGTYGISFVIVAINAAVAEWVMKFRGVTSWNTAIPASIVAFVLLAGTLVYGQYRLNEPLDNNEPLATFALVQRSEAVEYGQDAAREAEIFDNYNREAFMALASLEQQVDAVVWPESMFGGGIPWLVVEDDFVLPSRYEGTRDEFLYELNIQNRYFETRNEKIIRNFASLQGDRKPQIIAGCGVVRYAADRPHQYSGLIHIDQQGQIANWYGKNHLVVMGEYIPIVSRIPALDSMVPMITAGDGPTRFTVNETIVSPNICIETAVERVTVNHMRELQSQSIDPNVIVTVTNDGWFDQSSVLDHHRRCAQLVAVGIRRPLLSAANNGPTAWIDSSGRLVEHLDHGTNGTIIATPTKDVRQSLYVKIGDWPSRVLALVCIVLMLDTFWQWRAHRKKTRIANQERERGTVETS